MKKIVLTFGLISGAISAALMLATVPFHDQIGFDKGMFVGYTSMVLSFLLVFFGIRSYRENVGNGEISFLRAFSVGILITLISCVCYVATWEIVASRLLPDFLEKYTNYTIAKIQASGASAQQIEAKRQEMAHFAQLYANPLFRTAMTFLEPLPVGLLITLVSALILRRKPKAFEGGQQLASS
jgi:hypothetical protein